MLVQFMLKNVLSFKEETVIDMTAVHAYKEHPSNLIDLGTEERFLKVSSIYGANASGKSNLMKAMLFFQEILKKSLNNVDDHSVPAIQKYFVPFQFEEHQENSEFEMIQILDGCEYRYGFEYNAERIEMEWLYQKDLQTNRTRTIFERAADDISFGASVRKECDRYKAQIPSETLVLSVFNRFRMKTDLFRMVYAGITRSLISFSSFKDKELINRFLPLFLDNKKDKFMNFLHAIDAGIDDLFYEQREKEIQFITVHKSSSGKAYYLDLFDESEGTRKSMILFIVVQTTILNQGLLLVDELNTKLHPLLLKFIIDLFYDDKTTAQLIYTTHDTTLMDKRYFRKDQIWFVQKDAFGYSRLYALSDFKIRSDASFEEDYLSGVYGGIPLLQEMDTKEDE